LNWFWWQLNVHSAAFKGDLAQLNLVIEFVPERIHETDNTGRTPLHSAAESGQVAAVSLLLSAKADVNATNSSGYTPLGFAKSDRVKQLLRDAGGY